jgi:hypothetical protein
MNDLGESIQSVILEIGRIPRSIGRAVSASPCVKGDGGTGTISVASSYLTAQFIVNKSCRVIPGVCLSQQIASSIIGVGSLVAQGIASKSATTSSIILVLGAISPLINLSYSPTDSIVFRASSGIIGKVVGSVVGINGFDQPTISVIGIAGSLSRLGQR